MNLKPKGNARERILLYGGAKVGKTSAYLSIARKCPNSTIHVLDSDLAMERMVEGHSDLANVRVHDVDTWTDYVESAKTAVAAMPTYTIDTPNGPKTVSDDWLVVDFLSGAWDAVQTWYIDKKFGKAPEDYFTAHAIAAKKGNPLDGDKDWSVINKNHKAFMNILLRSPGHVLGTATAKALGDRDDVQLQTMFQVVGQRPEGQKGLAHAFHTIILLSKNRAGEHQMTTVGDRERRLVSNAPLSDFAMNYLVPIAGWRPA